MKNEISVMFLMAAACSLAQTPAENAAKAPSGAAGPAYSLEQFGPVASPADADKTFKKASDDIIAAGGGVVIIPAQAAKGWAPKNNSQEQWRKPEPPATTKAWGSGAGVTVVDARGPSLKVLPPQVDGLTISRSLNLPQGQSLPHWGYYETCWTPHPFTTNWAHCPVTPPAAMISRVTGCISAACAAKKSLMAARRSATHGP